METRRWTNPTQPQTLQVAVFLLYINAVFAALFGGLGSLLGLVFTAGSAGAGFGIANERRWGYVVALVAAVTGVLYGFSGSGIIGVMFGIALIALLLHPQSRDYQRIWFS